jgi:hypothetical protein
MLENKRAMVARLMFLVSTDVAVHVFDGSMYSITFDVL